MTALIAVRVLLPIVGLVCPLLGLMGLPGTWLLLALAGGAEWITEPRLFSGGTAIAAVLLAVAGEAWEFLASSTTAKRAGAGRRGAVGALLGGIAGALAGTLLIPVPIIGTLVGGGLGAFALSSALERDGGRDLGESLRVGRAAAAGQLLGVLGKTVAGVGVYVLLVVALFVD